MLDDPPLDDEGVVIPHDHDQIRHDDVIIKRVTENDIYRSPEEVRIATSLLSQSSDKYSGSSINIEKVILEQEDSVESYCLKFPNVIGAISFPAKLVRDNGGLVGYEPLDDDPAHGEIWEVKRKPKKVKILRGARVVFGLEDLTYIYPPLPTDT